MARNAAPIPPNTLRALMEVFKAFPQIRAVWLYGSRARGDAHAGSDIDLAVSAPAMSERDFARLWDALDASPVAYKLDVVHWERLHNPALKEAIVRDRVQIYPA